MSAPQPRTQPPVHPAGNREWLGILFTLAVIVYILSPQLFPGRFSAPLPFLLLYASVVFAANIGGLRSGLASAGLATAFILYATAISFGPPTLTGGPLQATAGIVLHAVTAWLLGKTTDERRRALALLQVQEAELESQVQARTQELERANAALRESEERFRSLVESAPWLIGVQRGGEIIYINPAGAKMYGAESPAALMGSAIFDLVAPESRALVEQRMAVQPGSEPNPPAVFGALRLDGGRFDLEGISIPIVVDGEPALMFLGIDVTDRVRMLDKLKASEAQFKAIIDSAPIGIYLTDIAGNDLYRNAVHARMLGLSVEQAAHKGWRSAIHPDDLERVSARWNEAAAHGATYADENRYVHEDGTVIHVHITAAPVNIGSAKWAYVGFVLDITEQKKLQMAQQKLQRDRDDLLRRLQTNIEQMPIGYIVTDRNFRFVYLNPAAEKIFGYTRQEVRGKSPFGLIIPETARRAIEKKLAGIVKAKKSVHEIQENLRRDGRVIICDWMLTPLVDEQGEFDSLLSMIQDVTERQESAEALERSRRELQSLAAHLQSVREDERTAIAREIHDELGQILSVLKMDLSLVERELGRASNGKKPVAVLKELQGMNTLLDTMAEKISRLVTRLRPEVLDHLGLLVALEWQAEEFAKHSGIECAFHSAVEELALDDKRATAVFRIVQEALTNVSRHARASHVEIRLEVVQHVLHLTVADDGIGLRKRQKKQHGSFGLVGMRERAAVFGGQIAITSGPGEKGTLVELFLPLAVAIGEEKAGQPG